MLNCPLLVKNHNCTGISNISWIILWLIQTYDHVLPTALKQQTQYWNNLPKISLFCVVEQGQMLSTGRVDPNCPCGASSLPWDWTAWGCWEKDVQAAWIISACTLNPTQTRPRTQDRPHPQHPPAQHTDTITSWRKLPHYRPSGWLAL